MNSDEEGRPNVPEGGVEQGVVIGAVVCWLASWLVLGERKKKGA